MQFIFFGMRRDPWRWCVLYPVVALVFVGSGILPTILSVLLVRRRVRETEGHTV
jgi:hypothetical protein